MKFFGNHLLLLLAVLVGVYAGNSDEFTLQLYAPDSSLFSSYNLFLNESYLTITETTETCKGYIHDNGTLFINGYAVGEGRDYLTTVPQSSSWEVTAPWTISNSVLKLNGNSTFYAVPQGTDGVYVLSIGEESTARGITKINIKPILSDNTLIQTWPKSSSLKGGKLAAAIVVPIVVVLLIALGCFGWIRLRRQAMLNSIHMKNLP